MSFYVVLNSDKCLDHFPENKPDYFRSIMRVPISLNGVWKVALMDIGYVHNHVVIDKELYVHCNACSGTLVDGEVTSLLRRVPP